MRTLVSAAAVAIAVSLPVTSHATSHDSAAQAQHAEHHSLADGEVRRIDREQGKLTIRHGPLASLDMPAMTMVFQVKDRALLDQVKAGDKIKFAAEKIDGTYTVTRIESSK